MKKLLPILFLFFAFSLSINAQEKNQATPAEKAKQDVLELSKAVDTSNDPNFFETFQNLFTYKHEVLAKEGITEAEKKQLYSDMDLKIKATLSESQIKQLMNVNGLYDRLLK